MEQIYRLVSRCHDALLRAMDGMEAKNWEYMDRQLHIADKEMKSALVESERILLIDEKDRGIA